MNTKTPLLPSQRVVQVCLFLVTAIALFGGTVQMYMGQPDTTPRLDNIHRFMAGIYFGSGLIALWTGINIRGQNALVYIIAVDVLLAGFGRLVSISRVGLPEPHAVWLGYLTPELLVPCIMIIAQMITNKKLQSK